MLRHKSICRALAVALQSVFAGHVKALRLVESFPRRNLNPLIMLLHPRAESDRLKSTFLLIIFNEGPI